jgi:hypothetical protein
VSKQNRTTDGLPRDGKRAPRGAKSKGATVARKQQRAAKQRARQGR